MKRKTIYFTAGLLGGLLLSAVFVFLWVRFHAIDSGNAVPSEHAVLEDLPEELSLSGQSAAGDTASLPPSAENWTDWSGDAVYNGGDCVLYENRIYRAKWWTQNEVPATADVWEDTLETPVIERKPASQEEDNSLPDRPIGGGKDASFKVVAYYPTWNGEQFSKLQYDVLTHVVYAFAIPNSDGTLKPLENPELAKKLIRECHSNQVKVLLAVGGWSYHDTPLEPTFMDAAADSGLIQKFGDTILDMCIAYGFDGVDMDWEHPRIDGDSYKRYEALMLYLAEQLHDNGLLLTSAVISGATADGNIYYDAAAHTDKVLDAVDWIHVMAYDGGDGERHSSYEFALNCGNYWKDTRHMPASKIVLGVPFYARPGWAYYSDILAADSDAWNTDVTQYNGMEAHYNGVATIQKKTRFAAEELGGIMIWEITQDTTDKDKSLLSAIRDALP